MGSKSPLRNPSAEVFQALREITQDERKNIVEELDQRWCRHALTNLQRADEATTAGKSFDARNFTWIAGVATDKVFAIREIPTQIVANIHEHRHDMSLVMDKLASAARVLNTHRNKGYSNTSAQGMSSELVPVARIVPDSPE